MNTNYQNQEWLKQKYVDERLSMTKIADLCDVSVQTISKHIDRSPTIESEGVHGDRNPMYRRPPTNTD